MNRSSKLRALAVVVSVAGASAAVAQVRGPVRGVSPSAAAILSFDPFRPTATRVVVPAAAAPAVVPAAVVPAVAVPTLSPVRESVMSEPMALTVAPAMIILPIRPPVRSPVR